MDTRLKYQGIIKTVLQNHANYRATLPGWSGNKYLHATPIHLSLVVDKVWIQCDETEEGIATDLMEAGIPKEDIVLGFRYPKIRKYTGFAVA
ncbi:MAG: XisI protein [Microcystis aeruginosa LG11-05]|nr:XisI protein [Microcystis aeruginosa LG11-05]